MVVLLVSVSLKYCICALLCTDIEHTNPATATPSPPDPHRPLGFILGVTIGLTTLVMLALIAIILVVTAVYYKKGIVWLASANCGEGE